MLRQIEMRARGQLLIAGVAIVVAVLLAIVAVVAILGPKPVLAAAQNKSAIEATYQVCNGTDCPQGTVVLKCGVIVSDTGDACAGHVVEISCTASQ